MEETTENVTTETVIESGREDGSCGSQSNGDSPSLDGSGSYGSGSSGSGSAAKSDSETNSPSLAGSGSAANFFAGMLGPNLYVPAIFNFPNADLWPSAFQMHAKAQLNEAAQQRKRTPFSIKALRSIIRQKGRSPQPILIETLKDILGLENEEEKRERLRREIVESLSALPNGFDAAALNLLNLGALSRLKESTRPHFDPFSFASLKKKKGRTTFTGRQVNELDKKFEVKKYPRSEERAELAKLLSLSETQVRIWFQNRRTKWKKQDLDAKQEASLLYTQPKYA